MLNNSKFSCLFIKDRKTKKVLGSSGIIAKMLRISGRVRWSLVPVLDNQVVQEWVISSGKCSSIIARCYNSEGLRCLEVIAEVSNY